ARFGMANRYGGVGVHQEQGHGLAHDVAASEHDCVRTFDGDVAATQNFHAARGSAGHESRTATDQTAEIHGMKSVDVFRGIDGFEDKFAIDLRRQWELDENAIHGGIAVQVVDKLQ